MDSTNNIPSNNIPSDIYDQYFVIPEDDGTLTMFELSQLLMSPIPNEEPEIFPSPTLPNNNNSYQESYVHPQYPYHHVPSQIGVGAYPQGPQQADNAPNFFTPQDDYSLSYIYQNGNVASGSGFDSNSGSGSNSMNWANQVHNANSGTCASGGMTNNNTLMVDNAPVLNSSHETIVMPDTRPVSNKRPFPTAHYQPAASNHMVMINNPHFHQPKHQASARAMLPPRYVEKPFNINTTVGMNGNIAAGRPPIVPVPSHFRNVVTPYMNANVGINGNTAASIGNPIVTPIGNPIVTPIGNPIGNGGMYMQYNQFGGVNQTLNGFNVKQEVSNPQKGPIVSHGIPPKPKTRPAKGPKEYSAWTTCIKDGYIQFDSYNKTTPLTEKVPGKWLSSPEGNYYSNVLNNDVPAPAPANRDQGGISSTSNNNNNVAAPMLMMIPPPPPPYLQPNVIPNYQPNNPPPPPPPPAPVVVPPEVKNNDNEVHDDDLFEPLMVENGKYVDPFTNWVDNVPSDFFDDLKVLFPNVQI